MRIEELNNARLNDFIYYCKRHRSEVDDSYLYDGDLQNFEINENNKTYILMDDLSDKIIGAISIMISSSYVEGRKSRFRIFHSEVNDVKVYKMMFDKLLSEANDTGRLFVFINGEDEGMAKFLKELNFSVERYSYALIKDDLSNIEPIFPEEFKLKTFEFGRDEEDWCEVSNESFKTIKGSSIKTPAMVSRLKDDEDLLENGMIMLYKNEKPVGHVAVSKELDDDITYAFISDLCVKPKYKGLGLGTGLLRAGLIHGKNMGIAKGMLTVNGENQRALDLYLKEGFRVDSSMVCYNYPLV